MWLLLSPPLTYPLHDRKRLLAIFIIPKLEDFLISNIRRRTYISNPSRQSTAQRRLSWRDPSNPISFSQYEYVPSITSPVRPVLAFNDPICVSHNFIYRRRLHKTPSSSAPPHIGRECQGRIGLGEPKTQTVEENEYRDACEKKKNSRNKGRGEFITFPSGKLTSAGCYLTWYGVSILMRISDDIQKFSTGI